MKQESKRPNPSNDVGLDEALAATFPASDPVSPPSHVEQEMQRRRQVLEQDAANRDKAAAEEALDEALEETFPASDPIAVYRAEVPPDPDEREEHKERRSVRRKRPAGRKAGKKTAKKKPARSAAKKITKKKTKTRR